MSRRGHASTSWCFTGNVCLLGACTAGGTRLARFLRFVFGHVRSGYEGSQLRLLRSMDKGGNILAIIRTYYLVGLGQMGLLDCFQTHLQDGFSTQGYVSKAFVVPLTVLSVGKGGHGIVDILDSMSVYMWCWPTIVR